ncbi:NADP-dependent 3-hydroxy acid dehydrogenase YdfG [Bryocella elongata]|uniref:NADP-dependent 3-hydroxy acid dehydrogenase YdfG n=1 Tax=Bryocella elongata TaxID=863522 RepID=A0A1H5YFF3_9BACT|nr:oxidoreductase [Bryocella elongata]SEG22425.1 NADP-dependent 3-hydroxy acid dehydrogenase YdfG [Bryocella elongata]
MAQKWTAAQMPSQAGKTAIVTGANSGIGFQAAAELAAHGAHVLLAVRSLPKGEEAAARIRAATPTASVEVVSLDVASLASVRAFAESFLASDRGLDLLINNAGVMALAKRELTADGFERQFATNHLGHFALTGLLLPALEKATAARVVTVASLAHRNGKFELDNLQGEKKYVPWDVYGMTKLANVLFASELERRARKSGLTLRSLAVHPGIARTQIFQNGPGMGDIKGIITRLFAPLMTQDDARGALPTLYAATNPAALGGQYIGPDGMGELKGWPKVVEPRENGKDPVAAKQLWEASEKLTGVHYLD